MKDYVKKNTYRAKRKEPDENAGADRWLIGFIIITLTLASLSAAYTLYQKHLATKQAQASQETEIKKPTKTPIEKIFKKSKAQQTAAGDNPKQAKKIVAENATPPTNEPKYDFYQLLPKMTVDVQKPEDQTQTAH